MNINIKPCPFCGGEAVLSNNKVVGGYDYSFVQCKKCGIHTKDYRVSTDYCSSERAINDWNRRVENG